MAGMNIVERRRPQDGQLRTEIDGKEVDVRVATRRHHLGREVRHAAARPDPLGPPPRATSACPTDSAETYSNFVRAPFGMVLCAGPTGSGKTTTLYATLTEISDPTRNVMTIEDPVEYVFPSINQIQTNEQAGLTFATGLRSILRQDPDVILVGEIRDVETARIAVQSALTGHLVLSSLHATDSVSALHRFLDMGIESFLVASSVIGIVGQRLVRRICPSCKVAYTPDRRRARLLRGERRTREDGVRARRRAATSAAAPAIRSASASTSCCGSRPRSSDSSSDGPPRTSCAGWPNDRACARCDKRRSTSSHRTSRPCPKSSEASTRCESEENAMQTLRPTATAHSTRAATRSTGPRRPPSVERRAPRAAPARAAADRRQGAQEHPQVRDHEEDGHAQGDHALLAPAQRLRRGRHPDHGGTGGHLRGDDRQAPQEGPPRHDRASSRRATPLPRPLRPIPRPFPATTSPSSNRPS